MLPRSSGLLLHPTSLPSDFGIGDFGPQAYAFVDQLEQAGQTIWQMLPLGPTAAGNSPYSLFSAFAGNPLLISPELLLRDGLVDADTLARVPSFPVDAVDFNAVHDWKSNLLTSVFEKFEGDRRHPLRGEFDTFRSTESSWLDDYSLFMTLRGEHPSAPDWTHWEPDIALRKPAALRRARTAHARQIASESFTQFLFFRQWRALRSHCQERGIKLMGDIPIYVSHDSSDVWAQPGNFELDAHGHPRYVSGVPPDYFSETGQLWGNPIYRWADMAENGFPWWIERFQSTQRSFDIVRLDHFRGFESYWQVPAGETTAIKGEWVKAPGSALFKLLIEKVSPLHIVAENLGDITPEVEALRAEFQFPGMAILQFGFTAEEASGTQFQPHNFEQNQVAYTGTHDNDTILGWWRSFGQSSKLPPGEVAEEKNRVLRYLHSDGLEFHWDCIRAIQSSVARFAIAPMQDVLGLGTDAKMNRPGQGSGNWTWRMRANEFRPERRARLWELVQLYERGRKLN